MNHVRISLFGRGQTQGHQMPQLEHQNSVDVEGQRHNSPRSSTITRSAFSSFLAGRASAGTRGRRVDDDESEEDGPKFHPPNSSRPSILARLRAQDIMNRPVFVNRVRASESLSLPSTTSTRAQVCPGLTRPPAVRINGGEPARQFRRTRFNGLNLAELYLADLAESRMRRQRVHQRQRSPDGSQRHQHKDPPRRFLFCFPWVKSRRARSLILRCFVSGMLVVLTLTIFLSLSLTKNTSTGEFGILLILLIVLTTIFFCHALIRLCALFMRPQNRSGSSGDGTGINGNGPSAYAIPRQPIRVILPGDIAVAGVESEAAQLKPPVYGQWRKSVRVDPSRLYWQRAKPSSPSPTTSAMSTNQDMGEGGGPGITQHRPPSYASDDGVDYVLDARPRSIAPPRSSVYSQPSMIQTQF